jgi:hypothetical protein
LDSPAEFNYPDAVETIVRSWGSNAPPSDNAEFISWFKMVDRRPAKYKGQTASGYFQVKHLSSTDTQETRQFGDEKMKSGDTLSCWLELQSQESLWSSHCFASGHVADMLEALPEGTVLHGTVKCLGQMKVSETIVDLGDEERGIAYPTAWLITDANKRDRQ